jgi:hypothetical protein
MGDKSTRIRKRKHESKEERDARAAAAKESEEEKKIRIDKMMDEHEGFHKQVVYYKGVPRAIPTDENGEFESHRPLPKNTVMWCVETFTREELLEFIRAGFVKVEELS